MPEWNSRTYFCSINPLSSVPWYSLRILDILQLLDFRVKDNFSPVWFNPLEKRAQIFGQQIGQLAQLTSCTDGGYINKSGRHSCDSSLTAFPVYNKSKKQTLILLRIKSIGTEPIACCQLQILNHPIINTSI